MTRYETIKGQLMRLRTRRVSAVAVPALLVSVFATASVELMHVAVSPWIVGLAVLLATASSLDWAWRNILPVYRKWAERSAEISAEIEELRQCVASLFDQHPKRNKGEQLKRAYGLEGKSLSQLEEALSVGMYREGKEVFVTAFMRSAVAVRVTASIGSPFKCAPADDPSRWPEHIERLPCDEVRQYHNHPEYDGSTEPSSQDFRSCRSLKSVLGRHARKLRSFIICWNRIREWKVFEYDDDGRHWLAAEFDVSLQAVCAVE